MEYVAFMLLLLKRGFLFTYQKEWSSHEDAEEKEGRKKKQQKNSAAHERSRRR